MSRPLACPTPPDWQVDWDGARRALRVGPRAGAAARRTRSTTPRATSGSTRAWSCEALAAPRRLARASTSARARIVFAAALLHDVAKPRLHARRARRAHHVARPLAAGRDPARGSSSGGSACRSPCARRSSRWSATTRCRSSWSTATTRRRAAPSRSARRRAAITLALLAEADVRGRVCADQQRAARQRRAVRRVLPRARAASTAPRAFPSDHSRFLYFRRRRARSRLCRRTTTPAPRWC